VMPLKTTVSIYSCGLKPVMRSLGLLNEALGGIQ
jgi:hypothetical protein